MNGRFTVAERFSIHDLNREIARELSSIAKEMCCGSYVDGSNCSWYHGSWSILRTLGLVSNPYWHYDFFRKQLSGRADEKYLVLGTADASTPFMLHTLGVTSIDILDLCRTPLFSCKLAADRVGANWNFVQGDVHRLSEAALQPYYDVIVNDAFLTRFDALGKRLAVTEIAKKLHPSSIYISTARFSDRDKSLKSKSYQSTESRRRYFVARAVSRFHELGGVADFAEAEVSSLAKSYMDNMVSYRFGSLAELESLLQEGGLRIVEADIVTTPGESEESAYIRFAASLVRV